jgi:hypothetical protein
MFDQVKQYATAIVATVVAVIVAGLLAFGLYEAHQVKALDKAAGADAVKISDLQQANKDLSGKLEQAKASAHVNDTVVTGDVQGKSDIAASQAAVTSSTQTQIAFVKKKYQPDPAQPISASAAHAEESEISRIQVNGLWDTYCNSVPASTAGCVAVPNKPASAPGA